MRSGQRLAMALLVLAACAAPVGGWDSEALLESRPDIASIPGQRLGDLTPYPALVDGQIVLVACRFGTGRVSVAVEGAAWPEEWGTTALSSVDAALPGMELDRGPDEEAPKIVVHTIEDVDTKGPTGLADTFTECDVSARSPGSSAVPVRGRLVRSEIRIRRRVPGSFARERAATAEDWVGAMLHELGHALGFQGHAAIGNSLVHLEQSRLRALARRALAGEGVSAPNVAALYRLAPGTRLGRAPLNAEARRLVAEVAREIEETIGRLGRPVEASSFAGDRTARIAWRWTEGTRVVLVFPDWSGALRWGRPIEVRRR